MKHLTKMVNFRTTPERYEQLKKLAEAMPWPRTVAALINHGLALAEEQLAGRIEPSSPASTAANGILRGKRPRPAGSRRKTADRPRKRKT